MDNLTPITREEMLMNDEPLTPITREEKILAGEDLNPVTRREYFLKKYRHAGGDVMVEGLEVTANGTYTAPEGKAYSPVEVAVPLPENAYLLKEASGSIVSFSDGADLPMPSFVCNIDAQQDLHGYDAPWVGGAGKNKCPVILSGNASNYGYTATVENDGVIIVTGTWTGTNNNIIGVDEQVKFNLPAGSYVLNGATVDNYNDYGISLQAYNWDASLALGNTSTTGYAEFTLAAQAEVSVHIYISNSKASGKTIPSDGIKLYPMIRLSSISDASWEPYENICPISGWTGCEATDNQKNFLVNNIESGYHITGTGIDCIYNGDGTFTGTFSNTSAVVFSPNTALSNGGTLATQKDYKKHLPNGDYKFGFYDESSDKFRIQIIAYNDNDAELTVIKSAYNGTFTIDDTFKYNYIRLFSGGKTNPETVTLKPMILRVDEEDETYTPYVGTTISITWQTEAGEVFGGYVDLVSGILTVTHKYMDFDGTERWSLGTSTVWYTISDMNLDNMQQGWCNYFPVKTDSSDTRTILMVMFGSDGNKGNRFYLVNAYENGYDEQAKIQALVTGMQIVYPLAEAQTYQLDGNQIKSLLGNNNAWCDTGNVDIDYFTKEVTG